MSKLKSYILEKCLDEEFPMETDGMQGNLHFEVELDSPLDTVNRSVLVRFEFVEPLNSTDGTGLMLSPNLRAGYFCYLETRPGRNTAKVSVFLPSDTICRRVVLVPWLPLAKNIFAGEASLRQEDAQISIPQTSKPFKSFRNLDRFECAIFEFPTTESFLASKSLDAGLYVISYNGLPLEIMYTPKLAPATSIVFNAALSSKTQEIPRFMANSLFSELETNGIFVFDASLHLDDSLMLAWYAGAALFPLQKVLPSILQKFVEHAGGTQTILFGASGGGFAAAFYAHFFTPSIAVVANPQTVIGNYIPRVVNSFAEICWDIQPPSNVPEALEAKIVSDLRKLPAPSKFAKIVYFQNSSDDHVDKHLIPFCDAFPNNTAIHLIMDHWGSGHVSPPRNFLSAILSLIIQNPSNWEAMLELFEAINAPTSQLIRAQVASLESGLEGFEGN